MQTREKLIICGAAYLIAVALWFTLTSPAFTEAQTKMEELNSKTKEDTDLKIKLRDIVRLQSEQQKLQGEIEQLRGSVPKSPDIDILVIDLEKMCLDSGLDLVSVEEPDKDKLRATEMAEEEAGPKPPPKVSAVVSGGKPAEKPALPKPPGVIAPGDKGKSQAEVETGLVKHFLLVTAQGSYAGCVELMKKLEGYQRVIGVNQIEVGFSAEGKEQKHPDPKQLKVSFLITAYYLP